MLPRRLFGSLYVGFSTGNTALFFAGAIAAGALMLVTMLVGMALSSAATVVYQTVLYRYARTSIVSLPFTPETVVDAWTPYQK